MLGYAKFLTFYSWKGKDNGEKRLVVIGGEAAGISAAGVVHPRLSLDVKPFRS